MESLAHILVVDDHREIRDLLAKYLAKHGFRVSAAESAAKARRLLEASGVDLVVLDIMMPGTDAGLSLCWYPQARTALRWHRHLQGRDTRIAARQPGRTVLTVPSAAVFLSARPGNRWPVMPSTHAGTA